ncbi:MAG: hypothetical protein CR997_03730 [Acidobacteria bacterium]|nr:MAG: hypothetical protein CR997_03730 [Acidobacteriota bacterium]
MSILEDIKKAVKSYLEVAYPGELPQQKRDLFHNLNQFVTDNEFWEWDFLEKDGLRTAMRWGNGWYPHMKLSFRGDTHENLLFYVDAHDRHFTLPLQFNDRLQKIRNKNMETKKRIEALFAERKLPTFDLPPSEVYEYQPLKYPIHALAIDDEGHILDLIETMIEKLGVAIKTMRDGKEAIEYMKNGNQVDIVYCDVMMPEISGYSIYEWVLSQKLDLDFYFVTGRSRMDLNCPGVPVIQKPFRFEDFSKTIQTYIENHFLFESR